MREITLGNALRGLPSVRARPPRHPMGKDFMDFDVISPADRSYNCHGYTLGTKKMVPEDQKAIDRKGMENLINEQYKGEFKKLSILDMVHEDGVQKIVVYGEQHPDGTVEVLHSIIESSTHKGRWESKQGIGGPVILINRPSALSGGAYGQVIDVYARKVK